MALSMKWRRRIKLRNQQLRQTFDVQRGHCARILRPSPSLTPPSGLPPPRPRMPLAAHPPPRWQPFIQPPSPPAPRPTASPPAPSLPQPASPSNNARLGRSGLGTRSAPRCGARSTAPQTAVALPSARDGGGGGDSAGGIGGSGCALPIVQSFTLQPGSNTIV